MIRSVTSSALMATNWKVAINAKYWHYGNDGWMRTLLHVQSNDGKAWGSAQFANLKKYFMKLYDKTRWSLRRKVKYSLPKRWPMLTRRELDYIQNECLGYTRMQTLKPANQESFSFRGRKNLKAEKVFYTVLNPLDHLFNNQESFLFWFSIKKNENHS